MWLVMQEVQWLGSRLPSLLRRLESLHGCHCKNITWWTPVFSWPALILETKIFAQSLTLPIPTSFNHGIFMFFPLEAGCVHLYTWPWACLCDCFWPLGCWQVGFKQWLQKYMIDLVLLCFYYCPEKNVSQVSSRSPRNETHLEQTWSKQVTYKQVWLRLIKISKMTPVELGYKSRR